MAGAEDFVVSSVERSSAPTFCGFILAGCVVLSNFHPRSKARIDSTPCTPASGGQTPPVETKKDAFPGISAGKGVFYEVLITIRLRYFLVWFGLVWQRIYHLLTPTIYLKNRNFLTRGHEYTKDKFACQVFTVFLCGFRFVTCPPHVGVGRKLLPTRCKIPPPESPSRGGYWGRWQHSLYNL